MESNELDSFTLGIIKRTQERNKFLETMKPPSPAILENINSNPQLPSSLSSQSSSTMKSSSPASKPLNSPSKPTNLPSLSSYRQPEPPRQVLKEVPRIVKVDDCDPCMLSLADRRALFERKRENIRIAPGEPPKEPKIVNVCIKDSSEIEKSPKITNESAEPIAKTEGTFVAIRVPVDTDCEMSNVIEKSPKTMNISVTNSSEPEETLVINNVPVNNIWLDDDDGEENFDSSLGSNASSLISNNDETSCGISQSTKLYPELPPISDSLSSKSSIGSDSTPEEEFGLLSPIKNCSTIQLAKISDGSPKKPEKAIFVEPFCPPPPPPSVPSLSSSSATTSSSSNPVAPIRTLSMYRREQKVRTTYKKSDDEDEIIADQESEAKKQQLWKEYLAQKSKKIEELQLEAEKLNKIIYQSFRALDLCVQTNNVSERIEAEKILLTNVVKKNACVDELYRLGQDDQNIDLTDDPIGTVTFNKLTLLVKGDFFVAQAHGHDPYDYHFICLFTCEDKVIATDALSSVDAIQEASLSFNNKIFFDKLRKDFKIRLDIYALALPKGKKAPERKIGSMGIRLTPKSKVKVKYTHSPALKASPGNEKIKCNFKRIGFVDFNHDNLPKGRFEMSNYMYTSPLEDQVIVSCMTGGNYKMKYSSYLNFHDESGDFPVWNRRWCVLDGAFIYFWRFSEDEGDKQPLGMIDLKQCVNPSIKRATTDICMRAYSFTFITIDSTLLPVKHLMAADIRKERDGWLTSLNKVLQLIRLWEHEALQPLDQNAIDRIMK